MEVEPRPRPKIVRKTTVTNDHGLNALTAPLTPLLQQQTLQEKKRYLIDFHLAFHYH